MKSFIPFLLRRQHGTSVLRRNPTGRLDPQRRISWVHDVHEIPTGFRDQVNNGSVRCRWFVSTNMAVFWSPVPRRVKEEERTGEPSFLDEVLSRIPKLQDSDDQLFAPWPRRRPDPSVADPAEVFQYTSHYVVMMRHGESAFNQGNVFTGWCDVPLTDQGREEARNAGEIMGSRNLKCVGSRQPDPKIRL